MQKSTRYSNYHELLRVIFHGALHLCGYKDKTSKDLKLMRDKEDYYLSLFIVPRGTINFNTVSRGTFRNLQAMFEEYDVIVVGAGHAGCEAAAAAANMGSTVSARDHEYANHRPDELQSCHGRNR